MNNKNGNASTKKPFYKKWWFFLIIGVVLVSAIFGSNEDNKPSDGNDETSSLAGTTDSTENVTSNTTEQARLTFELVAGKQGEYGKMISYNKGTDCEENFYAFYVPAGTYKVTNVGKYMSQINVYSNEIVKNDKGWEEPAETYFVELIDVNKSTTVTIKDGQHIEIAEPSVFKFEQQ